MADQDVFTKLSHPLSQLSPRKQAQVHKQLDKLTEQAGAGGGGGSTLTPQKQQARLLQQLQQLDRKAQAQGIYGGSVVIPDQTLVAPNVGARVADNQRSLWNYARRFITFLATSFPGILQSILRPLGYIYRPLLAAGVPSEPQIMSDTKQRRARSSLERAEQRRARAKLRADTIKKRLDAVHNKTIQDTQYVLQSNPSKQKLMKTRKILQEMIQKTTPLYRPDYQTMLRRVNQRLRTMP